MAFEVVIPKLGMTMTDGTVADWLVADGVIVETDQPVFRLTTEKLDIEAYAPAAGILRHGVPAGTTRAPGAIVGYILAVGEPMPALAASRTAAAPPAPAATGATPSPSIEVLDIGRISASPVARKMAEDRSIDLAHITGTGPGGRITKDDVDNYVPTPAHGAGHSNNVQSASGMRKVIARRMLESLQSSAQLTIGSEADVTDLVGLRAVLKAEGIDATYTDLVMLACREALAMHPLPNATWLGDSIEFHADVHIGMAVAVDGGLMVPVIRDAHRLGARELVDESARLAANARAGTLTRDDMEGSTFSVTALGGSGVDFFTPIINPPNSAILGIGRIKDGVAWRGETPMRRQIMTLSLTFDHRLIDGTPAAAFLADIVALLANPAGLLV